MKYRCQMALLLSLLFLLFVSQGCSRIPDTTQSVPEMEWIETSSQGCDVGVNLLENGDFSKDDYGWGTYYEGGSATESYCHKGVQLEIRSLGSSNHGVQLYYDGFRLVHSGEYNLSFIAEATSPKKISARMQLNGGDYHAYAEQFFTITQEPEKYTFNFTMDEETDVVPRLAFNMGAFEDSKEECPVTITISEVSLMLNNEVLEKRPEPKAILINQIGYGSDDIKTVFFRGSVMDTQFRVIDENGNVVFRGEIANMTESLTAGEYTFSGDFTNLKKPGVYHIETTNLGKSEPFKIGDRLYHEVFTDAMRMFYLQRCGCVLEEQYADIYAHPICHHTKARIHGTDDYIDVTGGWHDAGDYGRYVVPGAKTIADLLLAYHAVPDAFTDDTNIPESGNGIPDVLDEVRYELEWMLLMQRADGGVYHKVTCKDFPPFIMPEGETEKLYVSPVSTAATGDFAGVMAMAYEAYHGVDKAFADTCLTAAEKAYDFLSESGTLSFKNPINVVTGEYRDHRDKDERYFAACALFHTTGNERYHEAVRAAANEEWKIELGWAEMGAYGHLLYLDIDESKIDTDTYQHIRKWLLESAEALLTLSQSDGYHVSLDEYIWGSNMVVMNNAMLLLAANDVSPNAAYVQTAREHLNYIFGANPMSVCYVTGYGATPAKNPHHRPSIAKGTAMPGMLVGGPDERLEDAYAKVALDGLPPALCYIDHEQSYSTNEITIYWNSPLVYVMARLGAY